MAIFWNYIKGIDSDATTITKIKFKNQARPEIEIQTGDVVTNYGSVVTTEGDLQTINTEVEMKSTLTVGNVFTNGTVEAPVNSSITGDLTVSGNITANNLLLADNSTIQLGKEGSTTFNTFLCEELKTTTLKIDSLNVTSSSISGSSSLDLQVSSIKFV